MEKSSWHGGHQLAKKDNTAARPIRSPADRFAQARCGRAASAAARSGSNVVARAAPAATIKKSAIPDFAITVFGAVVTIIF